MRTKESEQEREKKKASGRQLKKQRAHLVYSWLCALEKDKLSTWHIHRLYASANKIEQIYRSIFLFVPLQTRCSPYARLCIKPKRRLYNMCMICLSFSTLCQVSYDALRQYPFWLVSRWQHSSTIRHIVSDALAISFARHPQQSQPYWCFSSAIQRYATPHTWFLSRKANPITAKITESIIGNCFDLYALFSTLSLEITIFFLFGFVFVGTNAGWPSKSFKVFRQWFDHIALYNAIVRVSRPTKSKLFIGSLQQLVQYKRNALYINVKWMWFDASTNDTHPSAVPNKSLLLPEYVSTVEPYTQR